MSEKNTQEIKKKTGNRWLIATLLGIILVLLMSLLILWFSPKILLGNNEAVPADTPVSMGNLHLQETIDVELLKKYAQEYNVSIEFLQRFFDNEIVYKSDGKIVYQPVDQSLPMNDINWDNLVRSGDEIEYWVDGEQAAKKVIDVSTHQGEIDWEKVKADGVDYAYIRLGFRGWGSGKLVLDEYYQKNIEGAKAAGIKVGVYFFSQAITPEEGREEAEFVLENIQGYELDLPIALDSEEVSGEDARANSLTAEERTDTVIAFCEQIERAGYEPMIYANVNQFFERMEFARLKDYKKWFAQYFKRPFFPYELCMWQYTAEGKVDGIDGFVDLNLYFE